MPLFYNPSGLAVDGSGNLFVADTNNSLIRKVTSGGVVTTLAGTSGSFGSADGTGTAAIFNSPMGPALDGSGNIYVADYTSAVIRKVTSAGVVTTFAGLANSTGSLDATGSAARFFHPSCLAVDAAGNVYVADSGNHAIRKITSAGVVTTFAGTTGLSGSLDGTGTAATFNNPRGLAIDGSGNLFVADTSNNTIRKITSAGVVTTLAGLANTFGSADGTGIAARFNFPNSVAVDSAGNLYVADEISSTIRKITSGGVVTTLAGLPGADGRVDGTGTAARFNRPTGVAVDSSGIVYVTDYNNHLIRKISAAGVVTTVAGTGGVAGVQDGYGYVFAPTSFSGPSSTATDATGNVYVADTGNNTVRKITPTGGVTTLAGAARVTGTTDGAGSLARFSSPAAVATDAAGNVYVADTANHLIRLISPAGVVTTLAGTAGVAGNADGLGIAASFNAPSSVTADGAGNVYVADFNNHTIRKIAPGGQVTTLAGTPGSEGTVDGLGSAARFSFPRDVAADASGNVYVADTGNHTIRKIAPGGLVLTLAGSAGNAGMADGTGSAARFNGPDGVAVDLAGNIYVADTNNSTIRAITPAGVVTTLGGIAGSAGNVDGILTVSQFDHPTGLSVDSAGNIYVADYRNNSIRKGTVLGGSGGGGGSGGSGGSGGTGGTGSTGGTGGTGNGAGTGSVGTPDTSGTLLRPTGIAFDSLTNFYVADTANNCIKKVTNGIYTILAGKSGQAGSTDGTGSAALFNGPTAIAIDSTNNLYVCDTGNGTIRKIDTTGVVTTLAGAAGSRGSQDGTGSAALFSSPTGIAGDSAANLYVVDSTNNTIRKITSAGVVTTLAGTARQVGEADGVGNAALFNNPVGITIDSRSNLYISDAYNNTIRKIASIATTTTATDGTVTTTYATGNAVTTFAGSPGLSGSFDGNGGYALFNLPSGLHADLLTGNVYVADTGNNCIRKITRAGFVSTVAGIAGIAGNRNGSAETSLFNQPQAIFYFNSATIIVADTGNSVIRRITALPSVMTLTLTAAATTTTTKTTTGSTSSSSSGGGAMDAWFIGALLLVYGFTRKSRRGSSA